LRWLYGGLVAAELLLAYHLALPGPGLAPSPSELTAQARRLLDLLVAQHFLLLALVAPAFAAGAVTDEKTRGTLEPLFTTHLGPAAIVAGKLLARAAQVGLLALAPLPAVALVGPAGGAPPEFLLGLVAVT